MIRVEGDEKLAATLRDPQLIGVPLKTMLTRIGRDATQVAQRGAEGSVVRTIGSEVHDLSVAVYSTHPAARAIEGGRRPRAPLPPVNELQRWAKAHGIRSVFAVARAIAERGIRGRFFLRAARQHVESRLSKYLDDMGKDTEKRWNA